MISYLIDGYNLLKAIPLFSSWIEEHSIEMARFRLEDRLKILTAQKAINIILVWDGPSPSVRKGGHAKGHFTVRFSGGQTADAVLKTLLVSMKQSILVSNDNEIKDIARIEGRKMLSCRQFYDYMGILQQNKASLNNGGDDPSISPKEQEYWLNEFKKSQVDSGDPRKRY
jgi:predicted RNA-binding protein with PIN domain